jgi:hypothetical protein
MAGLPRYITYRGHGAATVSAPVTITNSLFRCFAFRSDGEMVQKFLDRTLNRATPLIQYRVLGGYVFLVVVNNDKVTSPDNLGWASDIEVGAFVPVVEQRPPLPLPEKLAIWIPYLLINTSMGMASGREIWGYNKSLMSSWVDNAANLVVSTDVFPILGGPMQSNQPLLTIKPGPYPPSTFAQSWNTPDQLFAFLAGQTWTLNWPPLQNTSYSALDMLLNVSIPVTNLKQIRHATFTRRSALTQLIECDCQVDSGFMGGTIANPKAYTVTISPVASHQIKEDMGLIDTIGNPLSGNSAQPDFAFWVQMNWTALPGRIIYSSF